MAKFVGVHFDKGSSDRSLRQLVPFGADLNSSEPEALHLAVVKAVEVSREMGAVIIVVMISVYEV